MSKKYPGGYLTKTPPTVSTTSAQGVWTLEQAEYYQNAGLWPVPPDPYFNQVSLLLHGDGTNGAQNNTFLDSSTNNFTITRTGNVAQGTFSPFSLAEGQWSNYFDGSGDYLSVSDNTALQFGTGDFTIETIISLGSNNTEKGVIAKWEGGQGWGLVFYSGVSTARISFWKSSPSLAVVVADTDSFPLNQFTHVAVTRASGTVRLFVNGILKATNTDTTDYSSTMSLAIGQLNSASWPFLGYISNVRLVKGTAVYTSSFTPPTSALTAITNTSLLTCQSNRFKDNSSNNFTITPAGDAKVTAFSPFAPSAAYSASTNGGSGYFDGNGDYLSTPDNTALQFGTGDFTVEALVYRPSNTVNGTIISKWGSGGFAIIFYQGASPPGSYSKLLFMYGTGTVTIYDSDDFPINQWIHVAVSRSGTTVRLFVNGTQKASGTDNYNYNSTSSMCVGALDTSSNFPWTGYITNARVIKGTALYTANFTPPTAPLTAVANTQLLLNCTNAGIFDNAGKNDIETVGNAQISTSVKKYGTGSMYFDGSSVLDIRNMLPLTSADWTVECWANMSNVASNQLCIDLGFDPSLQNGITLRINQGSAGFNRNSIGAYYNTNGSWSGGIFWTYTFPYEAWTHLAYVKQNGVLTVYVNGVSIGTGQSFAANSSSTTNYNRIGHVLAGGANYYTGYIDDLRITNGVARYTANFTPPNGPFPNV